MVQPAPGGPPEGARPEGIAPAPLPVKMPLFSPLGYIIVLIILLVEGVLVYMIAGFMRSGSAIEGGGKVTVAQIAKLDLDEINVSFDVSDSGGGQQYPTLVVKPVLFFEKGKEGADEAIKNATAVKDKLREIVRTTLQDKGYKPLRQPRVMDDMKLDIKSRINEYLKAQIVQEVVFSDVKWQ